MKTIIKGLLTSALMLSIVSVVACGDSKDKKRVAVTPGATTVTTAHGTTRTTCQNCGNSQLVASAVGDSLQGFGDQFQFRLNFFQVNQSNQIAADGEVDIHNMSSIGGCAFLPGRYRVATVNNEFGQFNQNGLVTGISVEAYRGNEVIRMRINYATFDLFSQGFIRGCDGRDYPDPLGAEIVVESLNGQSCVFNGFAKRLYPSGSQQSNPSGNQQSNCLNR